jgi:NAD(P)-dependent dehydrogenase (short-subunit alcohol dehydrogenase family)
MSAAAAARLGAEESEEEDEEFDEVVGTALLDKIPMHRMGRADEIAGTIVFLSSRAGAYITGAEIPVDGGIVG